MDKLKYFAAAILLFSVSFVGGCAGMDMHNKAAEADTAKRMQLIEKSSRFDIYRDNRTGVHYIVYTEKYGYGYGAAMCVLVDADGKPLVSEGE
jgi:hypothetical protein